MSTEKHPGGRPPLPASQRASSIIAIRVTRQRKAAYVRWANGRKLADSIIEALDLASGYKET
jgi:hypothetical protein